MAMPTDKDARLFYRVAVQRLAEARALLDLGYTTVAIYLGGYVVETALKALIIQNSPKTRRSGIVSEFRGVRGHDLERLLIVYYNTGAQHMPHNVRQSFARAGHWSTNLRYEPGNVNLKLAQTFLKDVDNVMTWATGRL